MTGSLHATLATPGWERDPTLRDGVAVAVTAGVFWVLSGPLGAVVALGLGLTLLVLPAVLTVALAQVVLAVLLPADPALSTVAAGELPLLLLLGAAVDRRLSRQQIGTSLVVGGTVLVASAAAVALAPRQWIAVLAIAGVTAGLVYGGHRYTVVRFESHDHE